MRLEGLVFWGAWVLTGGGLAALGWAVTSGHRVAGQGTVMAAQTAPAPLPQYAGDSLAAQIIGRDVFRFGRRPAELRFQANADVTPQDPLPDRPKPRLRLTGLVSGAHPGAIIEGLPADPDTRLLRPGDTAGGLRLQSIQGGTVRVVGMDTSWSLRLRTP